MLDKYTRLLNRLMDEAGGEEGAAGGDEGSTNTEDAGAVATDPVTTSESDGDNPEGDAGDTGTEDVATSYADFEMPEGMELDTSMVDAFGPLMLEAGLNQDQAQLMATTLAEKLQAGEQQQQDAYTQQVEEWVDEAKSDKEFGGDKFEESTAVAQNAINQLGSPELKQLLDDSGLGNHPDMIRFAWQVGQLLKEDSVGNSAPVRAESDAASILYPK